MTLRLIPALALLLASVAWATVTTLPQTGCPTAALHDNGWDDEMNTCHQTIDGRFLESPGNGPQTSPTTETDEFNDTSVDGKWSWVNQGSATITEQDGYALLSVPSSAGYSWRIRQQTAPGTPFTIIARIVSGFTPANQAWAGLIFLNNSNGKFVSFGTFWDSGVQHVTVSRWTDATTFSAIASNTEARNLMAMEYLRVDVSSTTLTCSVSNDGIGWMPVFIETLSTFLTTSGALDRIGFGGNTSNSAAMTVNVYWFRRT